MGPLGQRFNVDGAGRVSKLGERPSLTLPDLLS